MSYSHSMGKTRRSPGACVILGRVLGVNGGGRAGLTSLVATPGGPPIALEAALALPDELNSLARLVVGAEVSPKPLGPVVADIGADFAAEVTPAATAPAAATAAAAGATAMPAVAAATPTVVAAAAAAPAAVTVVVAAAGADGSALADVETGLSSTGLVGVKPSDDGDGARAEIPFAASRTSLDAGSLTLVSSGVDTAGVGSITSIGAGRLAAATAGADGGAAARWTDGNATGDVAFASPAGALDAVNRLPTTGCFTSTGVPPGPADFAADTSDDVAVQAALGCVTATGVAVAVVVPSTACADFFEVPEPRGAADG